MRHLTMPVDVSQAIDDVLVYEGTGRHQAVSRALHLAEHGSNVHGAIYSAL